MLDPEAEDSEEHEPREPGQRTDPRSGADIRLAAEPVEALADTTPGLGEPLRREPGRRPSSSPATALALVVRSTVTGSDP